MTMGRFAEDPSRKYFFGGLLLIGVLSGNYLMSPSFVRADEEEEAPSILLPTPTEEQQSEEQFPSATRGTEAPEIKRPVVVSRPASPRVMDPRQLIYERSAREARAREARLESRRWQGLSSSRPSSGWTSTAYALPIGYYGWGAGYFPSYLYGGYPLYAPAYTYPLRNGLGM